MAYYIHPSRLHILPTLHCRDQTPGHTAGRNENKKRLSTHTYIHTTQHPAHLSYINITTQSPFEVDLGPLIHGPPHSITKEFFQS